ncbi:hypothetical protein AB4131_17825, partial [Vibrio lentus]
MNKTLIITNKGFLYNFFKNIFSEGSVKVTIKQIRQYLLNLESNPDMLKKLKYVFFDVGTEPEISLETIGKLKTKSEKMFFIIPSNDIMILRMFPFYMFDGCLEYPFNKMELNEVINNDNQFKKTKEIMSMYKMEDYQKIVSMGTFEAENEQDLLYIYDSLLHLNRLAEAEDLISKFYSKHKIPRHPNITTLHEVYFNGNLENIQSIIRSQPSYYCESIDEQVILNTFNVTIDNEHKDIISNTLGSNLLYLNEIISITNELVIEGFIDESDYNKIINFIILRNFNTYKLMNNICKSVII